MPRLEPGTHQSLAGDSEESFGKSKKLRDNNSEMKGKLRVNSKTHEGQMKGVMKMKGISLQSTRSEVTKCHEVQKVKDAVRMRCWRVVCRSIPLDIDRIHL